jgi:hypothetical protein
LLLVTAFSEAVAGGAVLALVTHAMIPEAIDEAGSLIVLPTTAGFLAALYLALAEPPDNGSRQGAIAPILTASLRPDF